MIEMIKKFISSIPNEQIRDKLKEAGIEVKPPFKRITWQEAMDKYGSDKPEARALSLLRQGHLYQTPRVSSGYSRLFYAQMYQRSL